MAKILIVEMNLQLLIMILTVLFQFIYRLVKKLFHLEDHNPRFLQIYSSYFTTIDVSFMMAVTYVFCR